MNKFLIAVIATTLVLFASNPSKAQGIPVYDASGYAQLIAQLDAMADDYANQIDQLEEAVRQADAITGTRNMGDVANGVFEQQLRQYLPNTWQDTLNMINGAPIPNGALGTQNIYSNLYNEFDPLSGATIMASDPSGQVAKAIDRRTGTTYAAIAASEQAYNNIPVRMQTYESLLSELNNSDDLKASVDLNARIAAENGILMNEIMRLNAIQIQQNSSIDNTQLMENRRAATFNQYDPELARQAIEFPN